MQLARDLHAKLGILGARYLHSHGCELVACEFSTSMNGLPREHVFDAAGLNFKSRQLCVVEAKTSRADFFADDRIHGDGDTYAKVAEVCWLICPDGVLRAADVPSRWGLMYWCEDVAEVCWKAEGKRRRRLVRAGDAADLKSSLGAAWRRTRRHAEGSIVVRQARPQSPLDPLSVHWDALVRAVSRKLTRSYLGIRFKNGQPVPQPVDCLEL